MFSFVKTLISFLKLTLEVILQRKKPTFHSCFRFIGEGDPFSCDKTWVWSHQKPMMVSLHLNF